MNEKTISEKNNKQDIEIAKGKQWRTDWEKRWDTFIDNDFRHLKRLVFGIYAAIAASILINIFL